MRRISALALLLLCLLLSVFAQGNGKLQIHYMDVGQGDGAVLISPLDEVVLFDDGVAEQCGRTIGYLQSLGVTKIDYLVASHYSAEHIGCAASIFAVMPLTKAAYDRGGSDSTPAYTEYVNASLLQSVRLIPSADCVFFSAPFFAPPKRLQSASRIS